ncbi:RHS repeat-associated core domain-containing protein [bacterium endosymbiont of Bathymodiolus sp. 5 South]|jgi:RHS repeat-associated protein|uniref:RHS repeat-associated core domain-containing protein n=1 Tax=bacterium endosymbiont of Bathymodiolus sp. 5 South TaxID=1181670 RepID=UPI0010B92F34|nr:RHS repeat-associated core domain-containing protein [bacterium endosymbiont of Bathymodiolus sp. 5 South]CAC9640383.1 hypothetical protein [uncultured Gammaproteobacteria bacterium]CAC9644391.1 hypothetical protein [uncultured Gammaproteobacteria bacterium]SHN93827.1 hypothetical protein BCLUESOX_1070 [bacterium endosymbiont of Bathymodiolus sp. 5 South]VVH57082.1 hypothetical protein BSPCLSOX_1073 [uncultured Gammaproteobacteria bacterium]VVM18894.1 hypothetical protein BSPWISOXPB_10136 [
MNTLEFYQQTYTYDTGNNLTNLSHQANSSTWQQTLTIHPNNNRGTETQQSTSDFDANGNLLTLNNIGTLHWHYNNTLNQLTTADKNNTVEYYIYDYQGNRVRTVVESNHQAQSQRDYLPSLDISINQAKQQDNTLHIGTHILSENSKDNAKNFRQTRYQLISHLQSNTLELNDKDQTLSYEHYYPYGSTTLIAGKDKTQVQQKRYRYTGKERDDSSGLCYYGARYLTPWLSRWISPDSVGAADGLNLYVYVGNNPLKYVDPTGHVKVYEIEDRGEFRELDILSPIISAPYDNDNLFHFPAAYQRLEESVKHHSINRIDEYTILDTKTNFITNPKHKSETAVEANFMPRGFGPIHFRNSMDFSTGELTFYTNYRRSISSFKAKINTNATEITCYQYLGMTKIFGVQNVLPKTFFRSTIANISTTSVIQHYKNTGDYLKFFNDFIRETDNGRSSTRIADAFGLEITAIKPEEEFSSVRLFLQPQEVLKPIGESIVLPPRKETNPFP